MDPAQIGYLPQYAEDLFGAASAEMPRKDTVDFLFAGNVGNLQAAETIVEAARLLKDEKNIRIHIVGGGVSLESCKALAAGLENITFYGRRDLQEMPGFYAMADMLLISLVKDPGLSANLPGKVQSYMAAGKGIVGSINGETARIIREADCGLCAPAEDPQALAQVLRQAAADPENRKRWGENAGKYYRDNFRKEVFLEKLQAVLEENCVK